MTTWNRRGAGARRRRRRAPARVADVPTARCGPTSPCGSSASTDDLYVRSAGGPDRPWYRHALASRTGRIRAGGVEADVTFAQAADDAQTAIDAAYHAKYDRYGPGIVGSVVGRDAWRVTIRLIGSSGS